MATTRAVSVVFSVAMMTIASATVAQVSTGRIDVTVVDGAGAVLQGVAVDIDGPQRHSAVTGVTGEAHFLHLASGRYKLRAKLSGFSDYLNTNVAVGTGAGVPLSIALSVAGVATQVQLTRRAPVVDPRKTGASTNISLDELQNVPSSRDPWVVLQTVPGIIVDRVHVGGAESGQQSNYQAKGAGGGENTWNLDGIAITDMAALGSSPTYYDFDMFQDMQVTTGGAEVTTATPGVHLNMVLKSGGNTPRGSARIYFANEGLQSNNLTPELAASIGGPSGKGHRMHQHYDTGVELGAPVLKDRLWAWGAYGKTHVDLITLGGTHDRTELQDASFKATGQVTSGIRTTVTWFRGDKQQFGRGAGPLVADEASYIQRGPTSLYKGEGNLVIGNHLFLSARAAHVSGGFQLAPRGGAGAQMYVDEGAVQRGSTDTYTTDRPQNGAGLDGSVFRGRHELKFGLGWRKAIVNSSTVYPGNGIVTQHTGYPAMLAIVTRAGRTLTDTTYTSAYGGDTWSLDRVAVNLGLRWDRQAASLGAATVNGSTVLPSLLPSLTGTPAKDAIVWNAVTPRLGVTYALNEERKTIGRASYSMFSSQLGATAAATISATQSSAIYYYAIDTNANRVADPSEILFGLGHAGYYGFDPLNPARLTTVDQIGTYATPKTHEVTVGLDHELMPNFAISGTFTYRHFSRFNWNPLIGVTSDDYRQTGTLAGSVDPVGSFSVPFYAINPAAVPPGGGRSFEERQGYHQRFVGFEIGAVKRMSHGWMGRFGFSTNDHREYFDGPSAIEDPTPTPQAPNLDGGVVVTPTAGSGKSDIYMVPPKFQLIANGLAQGPWGVNFGATWILRQGYATPYFRDNVATGDPLLNAKGVLIAGDVSRFRLPRVSSLDVRVERALTISDVTIVLDLDVFNITNAATVLGKQYNLRRTGPTGFDKVLEIMNPRILRLGARVNF